MDSAKPKALFQEFLKGVKAGKASKAAKDYIDSIAGRLRVRENPSRKCLNRTSKSTDSCRCSSMPSNLTTTKLCVWLWTRSA